jgi:glycosyltransferase involved in cell wall biosynthesis
MSASPSTSPGAAGPAVLALASLWPSRWAPGLGRFNRQQFEALGGMLPLGLVAPVAWTRLAAGRRGAPPPDPFPVRRPLWWYPPRLARGWQGRFFLASAWPSLRAMAARLRPQVLLANWLFPEGWAGVRAGARLGLPVVVQVLGSDAAFLPSDPARRPLIVEALRRAELITAVSAPLVQAVLELGADPARVHLLPNGVDPERFRPRPAGPARRELGLEPGRRWLVFVGNLAPEKSPQTALEALARLPAEVGLVMVGQGPLRPRLEARAARPDLAGRVRLAGAVDHSLVPRYLAAAEALVLPSLREGEPNAVLEALASGRPVAASRVGGVPALVSEGRQGFLAPPGDAAGLALAVERVLAASWRPAELAGAVAGRTWRASAARLAGLLRRAAGEG